jgi:hypothetical protein
MLTSEQRQNAAITNLIAASTGEFMWYVLHSFNPLMVLSSCSFSLSALIAEVEKSPSSVYYSQAYDSYNWMRSHLVNTTVNLVRGGLKVGSEDNCQTDGSFPPDGTHWFLQGLSVLRDVQAIKEPEVETQ